jgi:hypothetical protein
MNIPWQSIFPSKTRSAIEFPTPYENVSEDSLHLCEGERSSSLSTEFETLPTSLCHIAFDYDQEFISSLQDKSWAMESCEAPTLEFIRKDSFDEHGSFILDIPYEPCSHNSSPELAMRSALTTHEGYNHLLVLYCKMFRRLIVDAYVYHKHIKFPVCTMALTLQLKLHCYIQYWW